MEFTKALSQISQIHDHLAKGEVYRGLRSIPVALSAACGFVGAAVHDWVLPAATPVQAVVFWSVVAALSGAIGSSELLYNYLLRDDPYSRRKTLRVVGQFVPSLAAGAAVAVAFLRLDEGLVALLPGVWALLFGLGVFASRPYLPRAIGWVGLFYFSAGLALLVLADWGTISGWRVGCTFGCGQLAAALVLYWNLERTEHG